jgi:hypothetical protein
MLLFLGSMYMLEMRDLQNSAVAVHCVRVVTDALSVDGCCDTWEVWGPLGNRPQLGTAAAIEGLRQVSTYAFVATSYCGSISMLAARELHNSALHCARVVSDALNARVVVICGRCGDRPQLSTAAAIEGLRQVRQR